MAAVARWTPFSHEPFESSSFETDLDFSGQLISDTIPDLQPLEAETIDDQLIRASLEDDSIFDLQDEPVSETYRLDDTLDELPAPPTEHIWQSDLDIPTLTEPAKTWDAFEISEVPIKSQLISVIGNELLLASISTDAPSSLATRALCNLVLGRSSALFAWNDKTGTFKQTVRDASVSNACSNQEVMYIIEQGKTLRQLRMSIAKAGHNDLPTTLALNASIECVLNEIDLWVITQSKSVSTSDVKHTSAQCQEVLSLLHKAIRAVNSATTDQQALERLHLQFGSDGRDFTNAICKAVSVPWIQQVLEEVGVLHGIGSRTSAERTQSQSDEVDHPQSAQLTKEIEITKQERQLLRNSDQSHPLITQFNIARQSLHETGRIEDILRKAGEFENHLKAAIQQHRRESKEEGTIDFQDVDLSPPGNSLQHDSFLDNLTFQTESQDLDDGMNAVSSAVRDFLERKEQDTGEVYSPFLLLQPIISQQADLTHLALLDHIFHKCHLRHHLKMVKNRYLLGDGTVVESLIDRLFADTSHSAMPGRSAGFRLNNPSTKDWPPTSSQLSLNLTTIFVDEPQHSTAMQCPERSTWSFGVKQLSEAEIEQACEPGSVHAFAFLRLQYQPPPPLNSIFSTEALSCYEEVFARLLLHLRLLHLVTNLRYSLIRRNQGDQDVSAMRLVNDMHFLVATLFNHAMTVVIEPRWREFANGMDTLEHTIGDDDQPFDHLPSIDDLQNQHALMIKHIRNNLFISSKHAAVSESINSLYTLIIGYSRQTSIESPSMVQAAFDDETSRLKQSLSKAARTANDSASSLLDLLNWQKAQLDQDPS